MSYIRYNEEREFVKGKSKMYVYGHEKGISQNGYSDEDMINMLIEWWIIDDIEFKEWFVKRLAKRLEINEKLITFKDKGVKNG